MMLEQFLITLSLLITIGAIILTHYIIDTVNWDDVPQEKRRKAAAVTTVISVLQIICVLAQILCLIMIYN